MRPEQASPPPDASYDPPPRDAPKLAEIVAATCRALRVDYNDLVSARRHVKIVAARHACMWVMKTYTDRTYPEMGRHLGRDHSTVIHGVRNVQRSPELQALADRIVKELRLPLKPADGEGE